MLDNSANKRTTSARELSGIKLELSFVYVLYLTGYQVVLNSFEEYILKWISPQEDLFSNIYFSSTRVFNLLYLRLDQQKILYTGCLKIDATHQYDNDLLLRLETQKKIACPGNWYNIN